MKRLGFLYEKLVNIDYLEKSIYRAFKKKKKTKSIRRILHNPRKHAERISFMIQNGELPFVKERKIKKIIDGKQRKERTLTKASNYEHIIHYAVIGLLEDRFINASYKYSVASMPKRGDLYGKRHLERWIKRYKGRKLYVLKFDIKKFFDTIDRKVLMHKIERIVKDRKFLLIIEKILYFDKSYSNRGVPIGYYTSQWFANFYLQDFDFFIKQNLKIRDYIRYIDDGVILSCNKRILRKMFYMISGYLKSNHILSIKQNWQIFMLSYKPTKLMLEDGWSSKAHYGRPIDFMGYKFYPWKTTIRKSTLKSIMSSARAFIKKQGVRSARVFISLLGRMEHADTHNFIKNHILTIISVKHVKRVISAYDEMFYESNKCRGV